MRKVTDLRQDRRAITRRGPSPRVALIAPLVLIVAAVVAILVAGQLRRGQGAGSTPQPLIEYTTEKGERSTEGQVDSGLRVVATFPREATSGDNALSAVSLRFVDEAGNPARFGGETPSALEMKSTLDLAVWTYDGSVPSTPGVYRPVLTIRRLFGAGQPEQLELSSATLRATAGSDQPLTGGYVYNDDNDLWMASPDASKRRRLTFLALRGTGEYAEGPAWSPDGTRIAFTYLPQTSSSEVPATDIRVIERDRAGMKPLVARGPGESLSEPYWSSDGKYLYFSVEQLGDGGPTPGSDMGALSLSAWRIDRFDVTTGARSVWAEGARTPSTGGPGGDVVYLEEAPGNTTPGADPNPASPTYHLVRSDPVRESRVPLFEDIGTNTVVSPRLSPDGKWLVYSSVVVNEETPQPSPTSGGGAFDLLRWLFFEPRVAGAHGLLWDLFVIPADGSARGGESVRLTSLGDDQPHTVWLDNSTIAFIGVQGLFTLKLYAAGAAGAPTPLGGPSRTVMSGSSRHAVLTWHAP